MVYRKYNQDKKGDLTLPKNYILKMKPFWKRLKDHKLMSSKKYNNLIREKFTNDDIKGFINRQLVETRQITKHVANILKNYYTESNIIYLKANLSHLYREKYELFKFREINDYHHAHDAYLAAVIGEYKENYINKEVIDDMVNNFKYNIDKIDDKTREKLKFGFVINSLDENLSLINEKTGEVFNSYEFNKRVEDTLYRNDILVSRKTEIRTGKFYKETIYKKGVGTIPIKDNMRIDLYGGYSNINTSNLCLIEYNKKKKLVGIPINVTIKNDKNLLYNFLKEQINAKNIEDIKILKEKIPFESELFYEKQKVYIKGYGVRHKNCELSNATQLHISKDNMQKWKYAFMYILKNDNKYIENAIKDIDNIYDFLVEIENYSLFYKEILKIKEKLNFYSLDIESKKNIIRQILIIYHCDSDNGNLKEYGLGDRIGRITGKNVTTGILISKSATGIKEHKYEF